MKQHILIINLLGLACLTNTIAPAFAQYHQSYGDGRVVKQHQTGLFYSDPSYINCGTMSKSAQGKMVGGMSNPNLPATQWSSTIRAPGDGLYNGANGEMRQSNGAVIYSDQYANMQMAKMQKAMQRQAMMQRRAQAMQMQQQVGNFYVPGSNGGAATYSSGSTAAGYGSYRGR